MTRTFADMTPDERADCVGRWAEVRRRLVIIAEIDERRGDAYVFRLETSDGEWRLLSDVTPRLDLRRAWTPAGEPVTEDTSEPGQPQSEDVKPEPYPTRPAMLTTEEDYRNAPEGTVAWGQGPSSGMDSALEKYGNAWIESGDDGTFTPRDMERNGPHEILRWGDVS